MNMRDDAKAFVDGELDEIRTEEVLTAMESDADLRGDIEAMRALGFELRRTAVDHEVKGLDRAMGRFESRRRFPKWPIWVSSVAMVTLALAVVFPSGSRASMAFLPQSEVGHALPEQAADAGVSNTGGAGLAPMAGFKFEGKEGGGGPQDSDTGLLPGQGRSGRDLQDFTRSRNSQGVAGMENNSSVFHEKDIKFGQHSEGEANWRQAPSRTPDLIRTAAISVKVADAPASMNEAMALSKRLGGYYEASRTAKGQHDQAISDVTLRVPVSRFDGALTELRKYGEVIDDSSESQDVTAEIADVGARLKVLRAEEESYVTMLRMAKKVGEVLEIKDRLSTTRQEIESLTAQQKALKDQASYSTISCHFEERPKVDEPEAPKNWTDDTWANAVNGLKSVGRFLGQAAITIFVFAPVWLPILIVLWLIGRKVRA